MTRQTGFRNLDDRELREQVLVQQGFWQKVRRVASGLPFAEDLLAAYYAAADPATPHRVRAALFAALAYFVIPTDMVPDFIAVLGFSDDAAVLAAALRTLAAHIAPRHREQARQALTDPVHGAGDGH